MPLPGPGPALASPAGAGCEPGSTGCGKSASEFANVAGSLPHGFTSPNRTSASASAPRMPGYQISIAALTLSIQGMAAGPPVSSTTIVCGLAAATALTRSSCLFVRLRLFISRPSLVGSLTNTMAICDALASAAAATGSVPSLYCTLALGAFLAMAFSGDEGNQIGGPPNRLAPPPGGSTCAEPPPESTLVSACDPMTAMEVTSEARRGSWWA